MEQVLGLSREENWICGKIQEIVKDGKSGVFFGEQTPEALGRAVRTCAAKKWNRKHIANTAEKFSRDNFEQGIRAAIEKL